MSDVTFIRFSYDINGKPIRGYTFYNSFFVCTEFKSIENKENTYETVPVANLYFEEDAEKWLSTGILPK